MVFLIPPPHFFFFFGVGDAEFKQKDLPKVIHVGIISVWITITAIWLTTHAFAHFFSHYLRKQIYILVREGETNKKSLNTLQRKFFILQWDLTYIYKIVS